MKKLFFAMICLTLLGSLPACKYLGCKRGEQACAPSAGVSE